MRTYGGCLSGIIFKTLYHKNLITVKEWKVEKGKVGGTVVVTLKGKKEAKIIMRRRRKYRKR